MTHKRHVLGFIPFDSVICFAIEGIFLLRLFFIYTTHFRTHPVLTMMVANSLLNAISDSFAQTVTLMRSRMRHLDYAKEARLDAIREEYDLSVTASAEMLRGADRGFDYERLARFLGYGFLSAVLQFKWFAWLDDMFPIAGHSALMKRLLADQLFFAPFSLFLFFTIMNILEGNSVADLRKRLSKSFMNAMKAQYVLWPLVQILNFKFVPLMYQLPVVSSVNVGWNIYLSLVLGRT